MTSTDAPTAAAYQAVPLRLALLPQGNGPHRIDGAWWPHTRDLATELPALLDALTPRWGRITRVTVDDAMWNAGPRRLVLGRRVIRVSRSGGTGHRHTVCLLALGTGRCDLLVVAPGTPPGRADRMMTSASRTDGDTGPRLRHGHHAPHAAPSHST
ncbi:MULTISPECIES: DUF5994 family protein [Streptomyces]|uniref:Uncharacterized protein n=1 Tax=Streptomyces chrestomyceticus JCM 4735 TaxID=1306181 RepID=A0A7U9Q0H2_9ACTN|nr:MULTISPECIES: DUF5994 family protein [Streptomyces]GCD39547.1 hypothetical protein OEIGOIKO_07403 [Streptomyces chrestomyceticus JCM 4735]